MRKVFAGSVLSLSLCLVPSYLYAQDASSMAGVVTDASGAVVPGTTITLVNPATGLKFTQTTDSKGYYRFLNVPPQKYNARFEHTGFSTVNVSDLVLGVGVTRTQDAKLNAGTAQEVSVSANSDKVTIDTTDAKIGNNIDVSQLNDLPIQDRTNGITTLFTLQPGVDRSSGAVTGARIDQTEVTVDGLDVNDVASGQTFAIIGKAPVDSVQEFSGTVAGLTPDIGTGSGGQFQLVTKSGTNRFHGNINEYHRDRATEANSYFNNLNNIPNPNYIQNQFGGNIGGPIKKDKLFFFFNFADSRIIFSTTEEPIVPLANLHGPNPTLNYINNNPGCGDASRINTSPTCISSLSAAQVAALDPSNIGFNPAILSLFNSRYPAANDLTVGDGVNTGGYRFTTPTPNFNLNYVGRIDYNLSKSHKIFGRFTINRQNSTESAPEFPTDPVTHPFIDRSYGYVVSDVWTISSNKVNQFYYGDNISKLDFPDLYNPTGVNQYSLTGVSGPYTGFDGQQRRVPIPVVRDDFNWQLGAHSLVAGGTFKFIKTHSNLVNNFNFVGVGLTGSALASGLDPSLEPANINQGANSVGINDYDSLFATSLGVIGDISTNFNYNNTGAAAPAGTGGPRAYRFFETEAYVGDTWKVTPKLTLSYGVRYQLYSVPYEVNGNQSVASNITLNSFINARVAQSQAGNTGLNTLPFYSFVLGGKANNGPNLYAPSYKDFAPRFALAYNPARGTVFNLGAGIVYDRTVINAINFLQDQISYLFSNTNTNQFGGANTIASIMTDPRVGTNLGFSSNLLPAPSPIKSPYTPFIDSTGTPYGLAEGDTNFTINPNLKDPYSIAINAGVQQEFPGHLVMKLNYAGRLGRRLLADADANQVIDFPDLKSGQSLSSAFASLTSQVRAGKTGGSKAPLTAIPWFEDIMQPGIGKAFGYANNSSLAAALTGQLAKRGDVSDVLQTLAYYTYYGGYPFLPNNVGIPSQFGSNAYLTNQGSSNYHALLLTVDKNFSQGLRFQANYTWSHSIDNTSLSANNNALFSNTGFICDVLNPRACRANSDFDVRNEINASFTYDLPIGHGRAYFANVPKYVDEAIGGWSVSGLPSYRSGLAVTAYSDAYLASFDNDDPAIFTGNKSDLKISPNKVGSTVYGFKGGAAGSTAVQNEFRGPLGLEYGQRNLLTGPTAVQFDAGLAKIFSIIDEKVNLQFRADFFNVLNHPVFGTQAVNIVGNAGTFGQIAGTVGAAPNAGARIGQFSLRLQF